MESLSQVTTTQQMGANEWIIFGVLIIVIIGISIMMKKFQGMSKNLMDIATALDIVRDVSVLFDFKYNKETEKICKVALSVINASAKVSGVDNLLFKKDIIIQEVKTILIVEGIEINVDILKMIDKVVNAIIEGYKKRSV